MSYLFIYFIFRNAKIYRNLNKNVIERMYTCMVCCFSLIMRKGGSVESDGVTRVTFNTVT